MTAPGTVDSLARAVAFLRAGFVKSADSARHIEDGVVLSTPSLPAVWSLNALHVASPLAYEALRELADEQLADFDYQHIVVEDQSAGAAVDGLFAAERWKVEHDLIMVLAGEPDRRADTAAVTAAEEDEALDITARWYAEDPATERDGITQLLDATRRARRVHEDRLLGVRSSDGRLVAITTLRGDGVIAQLDDVYTVPEARGRGYARAMVSRAVEAARQGHHELIFVVADDDDWPKRLYARLGFRPVGRVWAFHRSAGP